MTEAQTGKVKAHNETLAAVLSLMVPGVGQFYNRDLGRGIFWLIITPGFWVGSGGTLGWLSHIISAYTAYRRAKKMKQGV